MITGTLPALHRDKAYSTTQAAEYLGLAAGVVRSLAQTGEFGKDGAWQHRTPGGRVHAIRIAGWAIEAYRRRHSL